MPWSIELIEKYEDRWDWDGISENQLLPWSIELIEEYKDWWDWDALSENESLPWSVELIEKFKDRWDWNSLSQADFLPWSMDFIERFKDDLGLEEMLCFDPDFDLEYRSSTEYKFPSLEYEMICSVLDYHKGMEQSLRLSF